MEIESQQEAYVAIMYACISVDEHVTDEETNELIRTLVKSDLFDEVDLVAVYNKVQLVNQANRFDAFKLIEIAATKIKPELKYVVYETAVTLLKADGVVESIEKDLLLHLSKQLNIEGKGFDL